MTPARRRDEAESRARALAEKVRELEGRAEMAEANLRTMLATVRSKNADDPARDAKVSDSEMEAILGVLKGERPGRRRHRPCPTHPPPDARIGVRIAQAVAASMPWRRSAS